MLKLYSWSDVFTNMIGKIRNQELSLLVKLKWLQIITVACFNYFPTMLRVASFTAYFGSGHSMTVDSTFAILTILDIIKDPMGWLPLYIGHVVEFQVSVTRLEKFFNQEEINASIKSEQRFNCDASVRGDWLWGINKSDDKKKHKELLDARKEASNDNLPKVEDLEDSKKDDTSEEEQRTLSQAMTLRDL